MSVCSSGGGSLYQAGGVTRLERMGRAGGTNSRGWGWRGVNGIRLWWLVNCLHGVSSTSWMRRFQDYFRVAVCRTDLAIRVHKYISSVFSILNKSEKKIEHILPLYYSVLDIANVTVVLK